MPRGGRFNGGFRPEGQRGRGRGRGRGFRGKSPGGQRKLERFGGGEGAEGELVFEGDFEDFNLDHVMEPSGLGLGGAGAPRRSGSYPWPSVFQPLIGGGGPNVTPMRGRGIGFPVNTGSSSRANVSHAVPEKDFRPVSFVSGENLKTVSEEGPNRTSMRGQGIGFPVNNRNAGGSSKSNALLAALERDRPFLRPVTFVPGENQKTLFEEVEDILHPPGGEDMSIEDHAPSANLVDEVFKHVMEAPSTNGGGTDRSTSENGTSGEINVPEIAAVEDSTPTFIIDTTPSPIVLDSQPQESTVVPLEESTIEVDIIVYDPPHPKSSHAHPATPSSSRTVPPNQSVLPTLQARPDSPDSGPAPVKPHDNTASKMSSTVSGPRSPQALQPQIQRKYNSPKAKGLARKERTRARRRAQREAMLSSAGLGLTNEELEALHYDALANVDSREFERRRDDSDIDWGTDEEWYGVEDLQNGLNDMDLDPEVPDIAQFAGFARGVPGLGGGEAVTIADIEDIAKMEEEEAAEEQNDASDIEDTSESAEDGLDSYTSESSDEGSPKRGFQARLRKVRERAREAGIVDREDSESDMLQNLEVLLDENYGILHGRDRKARKKLFSAVQNGEFSEDFNMRKKDRYIPPPLRDQWNRDRAKKARRKLMRAFERMEAAEKYSARSGGKKKKGKSLESARFEGDIADYTADMVALEQQIRAFLQDPESKALVLPPKGKEWRKQAHILTHAFNLQSKSQGKGENRFITLLKTTNKPGTKVNERKVSRVVKDKGGEAIRHKDGDEVGKMAPRISETNVGFRLLQQMGWEEGNRIGGETGGLVDPLTAIIKTSKLGLGASR